MKINKATVDNFRSLKHVEITPSNFNVFVGQNNHGKTNFFEAIEWFFNGSGKLDEIRNKQTNGPISIELEFTGAQAALEILKDEKKKKPFAEILSGKDEVRVKRVEGDKARLLYHNGNSEWVKSPAGFDTALNDFLPKLEYIKTENSLKDVSIYKKGTPITSMLSGVLNTILEEDEDYKNFKIQFERLFGNDESKIRKELNSISGKVEGYLSKQFPDCTKVEFNIYEPMLEDLLKNFDTSIDDGVMTNATEKGDGMQRALMLAILQTYCEFRKEKDEKSKNFIFLIDEGELHLHPSAQRNLKEALLEISEGDDQVFINTHSSVLIVDNHTTQRLFKVEKSDKITQITPIGDKDKYYTVYEMLGGTPNDLLLPANFLIVEGQSDYHFIREIIKKFYPSMEKLQIIHAGGDLKRQEKSMTAINDCYKTLFSNVVYKDKIIILCDKPNSDEKSADMKKFISDYRLTENEDIFVLPEELLESYYPIQWKKIQSDIGEDFDKVSYSKTVASEIQKEEFEEQMNVVYLAISKCFERSFK